MAHEYEEVRGWGLYEELQGYSLLPPAARSDQPAPPSYYEVGIRYNQLDLFLLQRLMSHGMIAKLICKFRRKYKSVQIQVFIQRICDIHKLILKRHNRWVLQNTGAIVQCNRFCQFSVSLCLMLTLVVFFLKQGRVYGKPDLEVTAGVYDSMVYRHKRDSNLPFELRGELV